MNLLPKVAVQYLAYRHPGSDQDVEDCFTSLEKVTYPKDRWCIVVIDNPCGENRFEDVFQKKWIPKSGQNLPEIIFIRSEMNTGFAGGHMDAYEAAKEWGADFVYLLNQDALCKPDFLEEVVRVAKEHPNAATVQSCVMLKQDPTLLNSCGNCLHFLGFGYSDGYRETPEQAALRPRPHFYNSGAGLLVRTDVLEKIGGLFDSAYFLYHEDVDLGWRARLAGYEHVYAEKSVIFHRYEFSRSISKFYLMERNRIVTHLTHLKWLTLFFLLPAFLVMEVGTFLFACKSGWGKEKMRVWGHFFKLSTWKYIRQRRQLIHSIRAVPDRIILSFMVGAIEAQEVANPIMKYVVNPFLAGYFWVLKRVVRW